MLATKCSRSCLGRRLTCLQSVTVCAQQQRAKPFGLLRMRSWPSSLHYWERMLWVIRCYATLLKLFDRCWDCLRVDSAARHDRMHHPPRALKQQRRRCKGFKKLPVQSSKAYISVSALLLPAVTLGLVVELDMWHPVVAAVQVWVRGRILVLVVPLCLSVSLGLGAALGTKVEPFVGVGPHLHVMGVLLLLEELLLGVAVTLALVALVCLEMLVQELMPSAL